MGSNGRLAEGDCPLLQVVLGITYGVGIGVLNNFLLFRALDRARRRGEEIVRRLGAVLAWRLLVVGLALLLVARWPVVMVSAAISAVFFGLAELLVWFWRKGGRID